MTIKDIARLAGVSVSTVSRVLNHHPDVSEAIRAQVLAVVEEHHFIPNTAARRLVQPQGNTVGVIRSGNGDPFYAPIFSAMEEALRARGWRMCLRQLHYSDDELACAAELERAERLRGIILLGGRFDYSEAMAAPLGVPFVCCTHRNLFGDLSPDRYSSVAIDDEAAAWRAVEVLYALGHRSIALLVPSRQDHSPGELRFRGYCRALEAFGLPLAPERIAVSGSYSLADAYRATLALIDSGTPFTALFAVSDLMAAAAIRALHERGRPVPRDCSVIAIDGLELTEYTLPPLTTLVQPAAELGWQSVELMLDLLDGGAHRHILLTPELRAGASVAPPP